MLQRNHIEPPAAKIAQLKVLCDDAENAGSLEQLLGLEGNAARIYFELFSGMIKAGDPGEEPVQEPRNSPLTSLTAIAVPRKTRSTPCCRWPTAFWPRT